MDEQVDVAGAKAKKMMTPFRWRQFEPDPRCHAQMATVQLLLLKMVRVW